MQQLQKQRILLLLVCLGITALMTGCLDDGDSVASGPGTTYSGQTSTASGSETSTGKVAISDPLTSGSSVGVVTGGQFTSEGYQVTTNYGGYIAYETGIIGSIVIEFDAKGYVPNENADKMAVVQLFDCPLDGDWRASAVYDNYYIYELRKRGLIDGQLHTVTNGVMLKAGGKGAHNFLELASWTGQSLVGHPADWDPDVTYHWKVVYSNGYTEIYRDGQAWFAVGTNPQFVPTGTLNVRIGGTNYGAAGPAGVTYSNVKISGS